MFELEALLDYRELTASYRAADPLIETPFTDTFFLSPRDTVTDEVEMVYFPGTTKPAPMNTRGSAARRITAQGGTKRYNTLFYSFNEMPLDPLALQALREPDSWFLQEKGRQSVEMIINEFKQRHKIQMETAIASIMYPGRVNIDVNGDILAPTVDSLTGAITDATNTVISADFAVPNANRGNLNDSTDGGAIITQLWSASSAMISRQLDKIRYRSRKFGRPMPTEIYVHGVPGRAFLRDNTEFKTWAKEAHIRSIDAVLAGEVINDLWGWNWHFVDEVWQDTNGTYHDLLPQTAAIICPKPGPWLRSFRGLTQVPRDLNIVGDMMSVLNSYDQVYGEVSWAKLTDNPVQLSLFMANSYGMAYADPNVVYMPTVFESTITSGTG